MRTPMPMTARHHRLRRDNLEIGAARTEESPQLTLRLARSADATKPARFAASEIRFVCAFTVALCVFTSIPYLIGQRVWIPGKVFTGVLEHSLDANNYLAYANQAAMGSWLFRNPMTSEPHGHVFFNIEWLVIGKASRLLGISLTSATNVLRIACLVAMCCGVYWLSTFFCNSALARRATLAAIMTGGGLGWIAALHLLHIRVDSSYFLDLSNGNLFPFYWALKLPHFLVSECLIVLGFCFFLRAERDCRGRDYVAAGVLYLASGACRPYDMLFAMAATTGYLAIWCYTHRTFRGQLSLRLLPMAMCVPLLGFYFWIFKIHPIFRWWSVPGNPAPAPWLLALGFGGCCLLLLAGAWRLGQAGLSEAEQFMSACLLLALLFTYSHRLFHFSFQFATNILVPMVVLGFAGLDQLIATRVKDRFWMKAAIAAILIVNSFTAIALTGQAALLASKGEFHTDAQLVDSYRWLDAHSQADDVVLADFESSNQIPQYTRDIVYCGYANTVNLDEKYNQVQQFLNPRSSDQFRADLIDSNSIRFVLLSTAEENAVHLGAASFLKEVFRNHAAVIFAITAPERIAETTRDESKSQPHGISHLLQSQRPKS